MLDKARIAKARCSFCMRTRAEGSGAIIESPHVSICSNCVELCTELLDAGSKLGNIPKDAAPAEQQGSECERMDTLVIEHASEQDAEYIRTVGQWPPSPLAEKEIENKIRDKRCYIMKHGGKAIGLMRFNMMFEFVPFLTLMWLEEPYRRKGYGTEAMLHWENEMRSLGYKMIMVSTQVDEAAQHFYRKLGYRDMGAIVMDIPPYEQPLEMFMGKAL